MHQAISMHDGSSRFRGFRSIAIANSTHGKYPTGADSWIQHTRDIIFSLAGEKVVLLTSTGSLNWELQCYLAARAGVAQIIILPATRTHFHHRMIECADQLGVDPDLTEFLPLEAARENLRNYGEERDRFILEMADRIIPVSVRPNGRLESLLRVIQPHGKIDASMQIHWAGSPGLPVKLPDAEAVRNIVDPILEGWLIHWTRASQGPWPGEKKCDFFRDLLESRSEYPRSAQKTFQRILSEKKIRASSWRIRNNQPVVAFSALPPSQALRLMRWRPRYVRFSFEPFGIAVEPKTASASGIRKVIYLESPDPPPEGIPAYLFQGRGKKGDWPIEQEHRHPGDFDLSGLNRNEIQPADLMEMITKTNKAVD